MGWVPVSPVNARLDRLNVQTGGVLNNRPCADEPRRSWLFRTVGYGNGASFWKEFVSVLRIVGYDSVLSGEEGLREAVAFLKEFMIEDPRGAMWWD